MEALFAIIGLVVGAGVMWFMNKDKVDAAQLSQVKQNADKRLQEVDEEKLDLQNQVNQLNSQISTFESTKAQVESLQTRVAELEPYQTQVEELQDKIAELEPYQTQVSELQDKITQLEPYQNQVNELQDKITQLEQQEQSWQVEKEQLNSHYEEELQSQIQNLQQEYEAQLEQMRANLAELESRETIESSETTTATNFIDQPEETAPLPTEFASVDENEDTPFPESETDEFSSEHSWDLDNADRVESMLETFSGIAEEANPEEETQMDSGANVDFINQEQLNEIDDISEAEEVEDNDDDATFLLNDDNYFDSQDSSESSEEFQDFAEIQDTEEIASLDDSQENDLPFSEEELSEMEDDDFNLAVESSQEQFGEAEAFPDDFQSSVSADKELTIVDENRDDFNFESLVEENNQWDNSDLEDSGDGIEMFDNQLDLSSEKLEEVNDGGDEFDFESLVQEQQASSGEDLSDDNDVEMFNQELELSEEELTDMAESADNFDIESLGESSSPVEFPTQTLDPFESNVSLTEDNNDEDDFELDLELSEDDSDEEELDLESLLDNTSVNPSEPHKSDSEEVNPFAEFDDQDLDFRSLLDDDDNSETNK